MKADDYVFPDVDQEGTVVRGLKVRDYIAIKAMQGIVSAHVDGRWKVTAKHAYELADAMIEASNDS